jgi:hypothetical protein
MATFCIEERAMNKLNFAVIAALAGVALSGCTQSQARLSPDFGQAVRQDFAAQVADPDAHYVGTPGPGSNGARVGLAQKRYERGQVIQPSTMTATADSKGTVDNGSAPAMDSASTGAK